MCLNNFVNRLQSFVHPCFDHTVFYPQIKHLEITLAAIEVSVLKWKPCPETILKQVAFAKLFFSKLIETTSLLKKFPLSHDMAESLVHKVIQLNVRTFQFYNTHGEPNPEKRHYTHILFNFMYLLRSCRVKFNGLSNVPLATRRVFEDQISQLEKTLQDLETYLPQSQGSRS
ncbi:hypothetical protein JCM33374_g1719 [Metschnikowia sp. JCM 33374]|nr:hypothetical protein JCM33374_g1719 [Metschnikowia sp. JCM 33374]